MDGTLLQQKGATASTSTGQKPGWGSDGFYRRIFANWLLYWL